MCAKTLLTLSLVLSLAACGGCAQGQMDPPAPDAGGEALVWTTTASGSSLLDPGSVLLMKPSDASFNRITLTGV